MDISGLTKTLDRLLCRDIAIAGDRTGLQVSKGEADIKKILVTLDVDEKLLEEAVSLKADLVLSHHPLIYDPIMAITGTERVTRCVIKLLENDISLYVAHTNYDSMDGGLNDRLAGMLGLVEARVIERVTSQWYKFVIFVPEDDAEYIRKVICDSGGGDFKQYSCCTFNIKGKGTFKPMDGAKPYIGKTGKLSEVDEVRIECIAESKDLESIISNTIKAHPYEVPAYDVYRLENNVASTGLGRVGKLRSKISLEGLLSNIAVDLDTSNIRWLADEDDALEKKIDKIAVINGSAGAMIGQLINLDAEVIVVGEIKYSDLLDLIDAGKTVIELGHGVSEKIAIDGMANIIKRYFSNNKIDIEVIKSKKGFKAWRNYIGR